VFQIALTKEGKARSKSAQFWMEVERHQILPKRTADSLRNFWKTVEREGLENHMRQALETNTWYCHAFCKIPKVKLICPIIESQEDAFLEQEMIELATHAPTITTHR
jgi:hypothetical protein